MNNSEPKNFSTFLRLTFSDWGFSWKGLTDNRSGEWWLIVQLIIIFMHISPPWPNSFENDSILSLILKIIGIPLFIYGLLKGLRSFIRLGPSLSPLPEPKTNAQLITSGVYQSCRHPLYQSLFLASLGLAITLGSFSHLMLTVILSIVLISKAKREEKKLNIIHNEYKDYLRNVPAIINSIPFMDWRG